MPLFLERVSKSGMRKTSQIYIYIYPSCSDCTGFGGKKQVPEKNKGASESAYTSADSFHLYPN